MMTLKEKWLKALKTLKVKQKVYMRKGNSFDVFGVLCNAYDNQKWKGCLTNPKVFTYDENHYFPPQYVLDAIKIDSIMLDKLLDMIDGDTPLKEIVKWIDENL